MTETLVITAGNTTGGRFLAEVWLPSLRRNAEYSGDVLIFNYDLLDEYKNLLSQDRHVFIERRVRELGSIYADRHKAIYECLTGSYSKYRVILCTDGKDIIFQKPIAPLFEQAKDILCYTVEPKFNRDWVRIKGPDADKIWEVIKDKPIINGGLYIGPIHYIVKLERFLYEHCKYFRVDQLWLNALIYYYGFPAKRVSSTWNWCRRNGFKQVNGVYYNLKGEKVAIFHDH